MRRFKNYLEVFDGYKHKLTRDGSKLTLVVSNVGADDCGDIECRAYNKAGTATNRARLSLRREYSASGTTSGVKTSALVISTCSVDL